MIVDKAKNRSESRRTNEDSFPTVTGSGLPQEIGTQIGHYKLLYLLGKVVEMELSIWPSGKSPLSLTIIQKLLELSSANLTIGYNNVD